MRTPGHPLHSMKTFFVLLALLNLFNCSEIESIVETYELYFENHDFWHNVFSYMPNPFADLEVTCHGLRAALSTFP